MSRTAEAIEFIERHGGVVRRAELVRAGFSPGLIASMAESGKIDRETRGVYALPDVMADDLEAITARWGRAVVSHTSALYLYGLSDRLPLRCDITVPREYNASSIATAFPAANIHRAPKETYTLGIRTVEGLSGAPVRAYDKERCVCDIVALRSKDAVDAQALKDAVTGYFKDPGKDLAKIAQYAHALGVEDELQRYAEVLL